jgi:hypothetical protein
VDEEDDKEWQQHYAFLSKNYNRKFARVVGPGDPGPGRLELTKGIRSLFGDTAFGRIEIASMVRPVSPEFA